MPSIVFADGSSEYSTGIRKMIFYWLILSNINYIIKLHLTFYQ